MWWEFLCQFLWQIKSPTEMWWEMGEWKPPTEMGDGVEFLKPTVLQICSSHFPLSGDERFLHHLFRDSKPCFYVATNMHSS